MQTITYSADQTIDGVAFTVVAEEPLYVVDAETLAALVEDARQAEAEFLAAIRASDAEYDRRARHDLRPGQRIGNR